MNKLLTIFLVMASFTVGCDSRLNESKISEAPDLWNRPQIMGVDFKNISDINQSAKLENVGWSDDYWATYKGGISYRWQTDFFGNDHNDYLYDVMTQETVFNLSQSQLDKLSPSEKFDIWMGDSNFSLTKEEQQNTRDAAWSGKVPTWFGLCHGWAAAALMEKEAGSLATVYSSNGTKLNFYSSDIKSLLTKIYADTDVNSYFIGGRCDQEQVEYDDFGRVLQPECRDTNPATIHLILDEYIANRNEGFIIDISMGAEVWNQPVVGYEFFYSRERSLVSDRSYKHAAKGTVSLINVNTKITYLVETKQSKDPVAPNLQTLYLDYILELDGEGVIIGGEWISMDRPDFIWQLRRKPDQVGDSPVSYQSVKNLLDLSRN